MRVVVGLLLALLFSSLPTAQAAGRKYTTEELCSLANLIVIATVQQREPMWLDQAQTTVVTTVTLSVERTIVGNPGSTVSVTTLGGKIGDAEQLVGDEPLMPVGSRYYLLLNAPGDTPPALIGGTYGARRLDPTAPLPPAAELYAEWRGMCDK